MKNSDLDTANEQASDELLKPVLGLMETNQEEALSRLDALLKRYARDARLHFMAGSVLAGLERYAEARAAMQVAVDIAPEYVLARFQLGFLALTSGDPSGANAIWHPLLNLPVDDPFRLFVQGLNAMVANDFNEALRLIQAGIERNRALAPLNQNMALLVREMQTKLVADKEPATDSQAHFLLKQYSFKDTRH